MQRMIGIADQGDVIAQEFLPHLASEKTPSLVYREGVESAEHENYHANRRWLQDDCIFTRGDLFGFAASECLFYGYLAEGSGIDQGSYV